MLDHFNHLRRQWAAKAQFLQANLKSITTVDVGRVLGREEIRVALYCHHISAAYIFISRKAPLWSRSQPIVMGVLEWDYIEPTTH